MPGPTGSQPSKLKSPVPETQGSPPVAQSIKFNTPLEIGGREPASEDLGALLDDYGMEGDGITNMVPDPGMASFPSVGSTPGSIVQDLPSSWDDIFKDETQAVEDGAGVMDFFPDGTPNPFYNEQVEGEVGGIKVRVLADGTPEVFDKGSKKYRPPTNGERNYLKQLRSAKVKLLGDAGAVGAGIFGALVPVGAVSGVAARAALEGGLSAAGSAGGDLYTKYLLSDNKEDYLLRRAGGIPDSEAFEELSLTNIGTRAGISGVLGGALGAGSAALSKSASKSASRVKALEELKPSIAQAKEIQERAKSLGIQLSPSEAASGMPELQFADQLGVDEVKSLATPAQLAIMKGTTTPEQAISYYKWNQARLEKALQVWDEASASLSGRFAGKAPSELPITQMGSRDKSTGGISNSIAGATENVFDRIKSKHLDEVVTLRNEIRSLGPDRQLVDPVPIIAEIEGAVRPHLPKGPVDLGGGRVGRYVNQDGSVNWNLVFSNKEMSNGHSTAYREVLNSAKRIMDKVRRLPGGLDRLKKMASNTGQSEWVSSKGVGAAPSEFEPKLAFVNEEVPGGRSSALTFDEVVALTDSLQDLAYSKNMEGSFANVLKAMADTSRKLEGEAASQLARGSGRSSLATAYEDANARASKAISAAQSLREMVNANPEAMGPALYGNSSRLKTAIEVMNDSEIRQLRSLVLDAANFGNITKSPSASAPVGLNVEEIKSQLFGSPGKIDSANVLFGEGDANRLRSILDIMERIPDPEGPASRSMAAARIGGYKGALNAFRAMKGGHQYVPELFERKLSQDPDIADIIMPQVRNIEVALESAAKREAEKAAFFKKAARAARFSNPAVQSVPLINNLRGPSKPKENKK